MDVLPLVRCRAWQRGRRGVGFGTGSRGSGVLFLLFSMTPSIPDLSVPKQNSWHTYDQCVTTKGVPANIPLSLERYWHTPFGTLGSGAPEPCVGTVLARYWHGTKNTHFGDGLGLWTLEVEALVVFEDFSVGNEVFDSTADGATGGVNFLGSEPVLEAPADFAESFAFGFAGGAEVKQVHGGDGGRLIWAS